MVDKTSAEELLREWQSRALLALLAYNRAASRGRTWHTVLGFVVTVLTAVVGTSVFASLKSNPATGVIVVVGVLSVSATALAAVQTFTDFPRRIEAYEIAARRYAVVRRRIEEVLVSLPQDDPASVLGEIRMELDAAAVGNPNAPRRIWDRTRRQIKGDYSWMTRLTVRLMGRKPRLPLID